MSTEPAHNFAETLLKAEELNPEKRIYTGVGSRETPVPILTVITTLATVQGILEDAENAREMLQDYGPLTMSEDLIPDQIRTT